MYKAKAKRYSRKTDPLVQGAKRYNPLGTKKQGEHNERIRDLKGRIHELEQNEKAFFLAKENWRNREVEYLRRIAARTPNKPQMEALNLLCSVGVDKAVKLGIDRALVTLCEYRDGLVDREPPGLATGMAPLQLGLDLQAAFRGEKIVENRKVS